MSSRARRIVAVVVTGALVVAAGTSLVETWDTTSSLPATFGGLAFAAGILCSVLGWTRPRPGRLRSSDRPEG